MQRSSSKRKRTAAKCAARSLEPTIAIVGTGLIGGSIGLALRRSASRTRVIGFDRSPRALRDALRCGAITSIASSAEDAIAVAKFIVLAVPQAAVIALLRRTFRAAQTGSLILDVAGLKSDIEKVATPLIAASGVAFVAGHPLAGSEQPGPLAARGDLFEDRPFVLCVPPQKRRRQVLSQAESFVRALGAVPRSISARNHDRVVAATSALPQLVSSAVAQAATRVAGPWAALHGPGLEGVTRLAASPAPLWVQNLIANKRNVLAAVGIFEASLRGLRAAIKAGDRARLRHLLRAAAASRRRLSSR